MELENVRHLNGTQYWDCEEDGSLRGGLEFVHRGPLKGQDLLDSLDELHEHLNSYSTSSITSVRTSVHVHIDTTDMSVSAMRAFLALCVAFEPILFAMSGEKRHGNPYCQSISGMAGTIRSFLNGHLDEEDLPHRWEKYTSINLTRLGDLGTYEFRMMEGTNDMERVISLIALLSQIKKVAISLNFRGVNSLINRFLPMANTIMSELVDTIPVEHLGNIRKSRDIVAGISQLRRVLSVGKHGVNINGYVEAPTVRLKEPLKDMPGVDKIPAVMANKLFGNKVSDFVVEADLEKL